MVASFRVQINPSLIFGNSVDLGGGSFNYSNHAHTGFNTNTFSSDKIFIYKNYGICSNTVGGNVILSESGGTFGSGTAKDRAASANVPANYIYTLFSSSNPNDYHYGVSNNTSAGGANFTILSNWPIPDNHRLFRTWGLMGDPTNALHLFFVDAPTEVKPTARYMPLINPPHRTHPPF